MSFSSINEELNFQPEKQNIDSAIYLLGTKEKNIFEKLQQLQILIQKHSCLKELCI